MGVLGDFLFLGEGGWRWDWEFFLAAAREADMRASKAEGGLLDMVQRGVAVAREGVKGKEKKEETLIVKER